MLNGLALSCIKAVSLMRKRTDVWADKDKRPITATTACSQDSQRKNTSCVNTLDDIGASNQNISRRN